MNCNSVNIVEVIQNEDKLKEMAMAKCPFHKGGEENNASMKIYENWYYSTLVRRLSAISFLRKHDNLDFIEAVNYWHHT